MSENSSENSTSASLAKPSRKTKNSMSLKIDIPQPELLKPKITIFGVGGAGGNALNNMIRSSLEGVEFVAANTDAQALANSLAQDRIQLGLKITRGLGAGSFPDRGKVAAEENIAEIEKFLEGCNMVFIAAGMGGGTGTGAAPVIAKLAREHDILTVGVVTKPFHFEGKYRMETAEAGIEELKKYVDTLIVIPNQNLFRIANETTTFESAFKMADDVLHAGVRGVTDLITMPGLVNLDFADIRTIMTKMGKAMMGTGEATGENRAILACEAAISNPLLDDISIKGAKGVLVNMTGGPDMTLFEADMAVNAIRKEVDSNANIIFGSAFNENMKGKIRISVVATGIDSEEFKKDNQKITESSEPSRFRVSLGKDRSEKSNFFDPGISLKPTEEELEEISEINFKPKKSYSKEENLNYGKFSGLEKNEEKLTTEKKHIEKNHFEGQSSFFGIDDLQKFDEEEIHESKKSHKNLKQNNKNHKDNSGGFSLFSFMNSTKNKEEIIKTNKKPHKIEDDEKAEEEQNHSNHSKTKKDKNSEADKKRKQFFGGTILDSLDDNKEEIEKFDDDIINVPAFFRKKK